MAESVMLQPMWPLKTNRPYTQYQTNIIQLFTTNWALLFTGIVIVIVLNQQPIQAKQRKGQVESFYQKEMNKAVGYAYGAIHMYEVEKRWRYGFC